MDRQTLLKAALPPFTDKYEPIFAVPYKKIITAQGFSYIVKDESQKKPLKAVIHYSADYDINENAGNLKQIQATLTTRERLKGNVLIEYKGMILTPLNYSDINETIGSYDYACVGITADKLSLVNAPKEAVGFSCFDLLWDMPNYDILPQYLGANDYNQGVVFLSIENQKAIGLPQEDSLGAWQLMQETAILRLINFNRLDFLKFYNNLLDYSEISGKFGIIGECEIKELNDIDSRAVIKSVAYELRVDLSYSIQYDKADDKIIRAVIFKVEG